MTIAQKIENYISRSSWIRKMFEEGARLKEQHGAENVFDFSLGNPNVPPPEKFKTVLTEIAANSGPGDHGYMPNTGYPLVRQKVAHYLCVEQEAEVTPNDVIMTCGAAGALNITLKAILDPGDEVLSPAPYFVEYGFYADNHGGVFKSIPTRDDFTLDLTAISDAVNARTKAVIINSPNNPTGQIYDRESLSALGRLLKEKGEAFGRTIYLLSDEPYRKIVYDNAEVPGIFSCYDDSIIATSYSKDISLPGERIGFAAVNPKAVHREALLAAMALANRILGFVNAPALMQRVVGELQGVTVDIAEYARKRTLLCDGLKSAGYEFVMPKGAFYLFPKSPLEDEVEFVNLLKEELILAVPGSGFGSPGYFRIAFCVDDNTIIKSLPGFHRVMEKINNP
jgi:aspartate aminotransferase